MGYEIVFTGQEQVELVQIPQPERAAPGHVSGRTLYSLISPGTELQGGYLQERTTPASTGYAAVFRVEDVGEGVSAAVKPGDIVFGMGPHRSFQHEAAEKVIVIPDGLQPWAATLTRLMNIGMTALATTKARPGSKVLITGAGPVGLLAALAFQRCGYEVFVTDPAEARIEAALQAGISHASSRLPIGDPKWDGQISLVMDCSGHEAAVMAGCGMIRKGGEVVLAGVPWKRNSEVYAQELLSLVFHRYAVLRSGWEWELPIFPQDFVSSSMYLNLETGMRWLANGLIDPRPHARMASPAEAPLMYGGLADRSIAELFVLFDWNETRLRADDTGEALL